MGLFGRRSRRDNQPINYDKAFNDMKEQGLGYNFGGQSNPLGILGMSGLDLMKIVTGKTPLPSVGQGQTQAAANPQPTQASPRQTQPINYGQGVPVFNVDGEAEPITVQDADGNDYTYTPGVYKMSDTLLKMAEAAKARNLLRNTPNARPSMVGAVGGKQSNGAGREYTGSDIDTSGIPEDIRPVPQPTQPAAPVDSFANRAETPLLGGTVQENLKEYNIGVPYGYPEREDVLNKNIKKALNGISPQPKYFW